ncbi:hypothetical protein QR680_005048 [Steinernema hermaphroditum]|uniref:Uncharacterized protein n=1 Tax=Steinernema hermaphroditum TaxID=289476 RepID=A0AA39HRX2_9BILA|nr:hypothetical protein QR680_005048 [Steinernema hermaphroditum]
MQTPSFQFLPSVRSAEMVSECGDYVEVQCNESVEDSVAYKQKKACTLKIVPAAALEEVVVFKTLFVGKALLVKIRPRIETHRVRRLCDSGVL